MMKFALWKVATYNLKLIKSNNIFKHFCKYLTHFTFFFFNRIFILCLKLLCFVFLFSGAELEYTNLAFSYSKHLIAATSGLPDFTLFLWNWCTGELQCSAKVIDCRFLNL